ncbi:MAG TPA: copper transporter [Actinomycetes bacterium]|nr:copper transporter [Actinomycetes bacterium]
MINLRYHIVSLVAVFLALALGMVVGGTVLNEGTGRAQRAFSDLLRRTSQQTQAENTELRSQVKNYKAFGEQVLPQLAHDKLKGRSVVLIDTDRVDDGARASVTDAVEAAGATVQGRLTFASDRVSLAAQDDRTKLGQLLGLSTTDPDALRTAMLEQFTGRLTIPAKLPKSDQERPQDMITALSDAKFFADLNLPGRVRDGTELFPKVGSLFVIIGPTDGSTTPPPKSFLVPLADRLSARSPAPVAGVESQTGVSGWLQTLRGDKEITQRVSTVDDVDAVYGQVALVDAFALQLANRPPGQYGFKQGSTGLLPEGGPA